MPKNLAEGDSEHGTQPVAIEVDGADGLTYNGKAQTPGVAASYAGADADPDATGMQLVAGADYTLAYANNTNAGTNTAQVTVYGAGNYTGSRTLTFGIAPQTVYVKVLGASKVYGAIDPAYTYEAYTEWSAPAAGDGTGDGAGGAGRGRERLRRGQQDRRLRVHGRSRPRGRRGRGKLCVRSWHAFRFVQLPTGVA